MSKEANMVLARAMVEVRYAPGVAQLITALFSTVLYTTTTARHVPCDCDNTVL